MKLNFSNIEVSNAKIQGRDFAIEDKTTGKIYLSNKAYTNKMFKEAGWGGVNVIKVLEDYADKYVSEIGSLLTSTLYLDDVSDVFVVTSDSAVNWINEMFTQFEQHGVEVFKEKALEPFYQNVEVYVRNAKGAEYVLYYDLCKETLIAYSLDESDETIYGMMPEGKFNLNDTADLNLLTNIIIDGDPDLVKDITSLEVPLSVAECIDLLSVLKFVRKHKKMMCLTDLGEACKFDVKDIDKVIDDYNLLTWITRHTTFTDFTFEDAYQLIGMNLDSHLLLEFVDFYIKNSDELTDKFLCK